MRLWDLRDKSGRVVVDEIEATSEEMLTGVEAANTMHPDAAPHYATSPAPGPYQDGDDHNPDEWIASEDTLDRSIIEAATGRPL